MSNYGADSNPDENNFHMVSYGFWFTKPEKLQGDQYTIESDFQVLKFADGTNRINIRFKVKPSEIPGI